MAATSFFEGRCGVADAPLPPGAAFASNAALWLEASRRDAEGKGAAVEKLRAELARVRATLADRRDAIDNGFQDGLAYADRADGAPPAVFAQVFARRSARRSSRRSQAPKRRARASTAA